MEAHDLGFQLLDYLAKSLIERRTIATRHRGCRIDPKLLVVRLQPLTPAHLACVVWHRRRMAEEVDVNRRAGSCVVFPQLFPQLLRRKHRTRNSAEATTVRYPNRQRGIYGACHWT